MPIYEYRCSDCKRKVSIFWRTLSAVNESEARCSYCGSRRLSRLVSKVRVIRGGSATDDTSSAGASDDDMDIPGLEGLDENDPRSLGRFLRKMAAETGEDMGPEFDEVVGRLEKGEDPEKIEESMGDLFGEPPPGLDDDDMGMGELSDASAEGESTSDNSKDTADSKSAKTSETSRRNVVVSAKAKRAASSRRKPARKTATRSATRSKRK
ncbi:MAG: FmdB family zinc ribbon protein [Anaerolineae bacterium]